MVRTFVKAAMAVAVIAVLSIATLGCSSDPEGVYGATARELTGTWSSQGPPAAVFTMNEDRTLVAEDWPIDVLCPGSEPDVIPLLTGIWDESDADNSVMVSLQSPCRVSLQGYLQRVDDSLELWFYEDGADLEGFPEPEWRFRQQP